VMTACGGERCDVKGAVLYLSSRQFTGCVIAILHMLFANVALLSAWSTPLIILPCPPLLQQQQQVLTPVGLWPPGRLAPCTC
jgi:hypothetical protein